MRASGPRSGWDRGRGPAGRGPPPRRLGGFRSLSDHNPPNVTARIGLRPTTALEAAGGLLVAEVVPDPWDLGGGGILALLEPVAEGLTRLAGHDLRQGGGADLAADPCRLPHGALHLQIALTAGLGAEHVARNQAHGEPQPEASHHRSPPVPCAGVT